MKRILSIITLIILTITLVGCNEDLNTSRDLPKVNGRDKVHLTYDKVLETINELKQIGNNVTDDVSFEIKGKLNLTKTKDDKKYLNGYQGKIKSYLSKENFKVANIDYKSSFYEDRTELLGNVYSVQEDGKIYYDLNSIISTINKNEAYQIKEDLNESSFPNLIDTIMINKDKVLQITEIPIFEQLVNKYDGLTFYEKPNYFAYKIVFNKTMLYKYREIFNLTRAKLNKFRKLDGQIVAIFEYGKLIDYGVKINVDTKLGNDNLILELKVLYKTKVSIPDLPDLSNYRDGSLDEIINGY